MRQADQTRAGLAGCAAVAAFNPEAARHQNLFKASHHPNPPNSTCTHSPTQSYYYTSLCPSPTPTSSTTPLQHPVRHSSSFSCACTTFHSLLSHQHSTGCELALSHHSPQALCLRSLPLCPSSQTTSAMADHQSAQDGFAPIFKALATMQSNLSGKEKTQAHEFLEKFQKSVRSRFSFRPSHCLTTCPVRGLECHTHHPSRLQSPR